MYIKEPKVARNPMTASAVYTFGCGRTVIRAGEFTRDMTTPGKSKTSAPHRSGKQEPEHSAADVVTLLAATIKNGSLHGEPIPIHTPIRHQMPGPLITISLGAMVVPGACNVTTPTDSVASAFCTTTSPM